MRVLSLLLISAISIISISSVKQNSEYESVEETLNYYLDGGTNKDFETLKKAFHENATMMYLNEEGYQEVNVIDYFGSVMKPGPPSERETRIANITISGDAASARLELDYGDMMIVDFMNLLKVDGEWKIVNKIFTRI